MYLQDEPEDPLDLGDFGQFGGYIRDGRIHFPDDESLEKYLAYKEKRKSENQKSD